MTIQFFPHQSYVYLTSGNHDKIWYHWKAIFSFWAQATIFWRTLCNTMADKVHCNAYRNGNYWVQHNTHWENEMDQRIFLESNHIHCHKENQQRNHPYHDSFCHWSCKNSINFLFFQNDLPLKMIDFRWNSNNHISKLLLILGGYSYCEKNFPKWT